MGASERTPLFLYPTSVVSGQYLALLTPLIHAVVVVEPPVLLD